MRERRRTGIAAWLLAARPTLREATLGAAAWAAGMAANAGLMLISRGWWGAPLLHVGLLFALGGALAFPPALWAARLFIRKRTGERAFAAHVLFLAASTIGFTGALFALEYRQYYAQWHAPAFTVTWCFQLVFTALVALYQFAVLGVRLFMPFGFAALFVVAFRLTRAAR